MERVVVDRRSDGGTLGVLRRKVGLKVQRPDRSRDAGKKGGRNNLIVHGLVLPVNTQTNKEGCFERYWLSRAQGHGGEMSPPLNILYLLFTSLILSSPL